MDEIKAMDRAMRGFKGTLPQYQNKVEAGAPLRRLVKQGPLIKFSRIRKSPRFIILVCFPCSIIIIVLVYVRLYIIYMYVYPDYTVYMTVYIRVCPLLVVVS